MSDIAHHRASRTPFLAELPLFSWAVRISPDNHPSLAARRLALRFGLSPAVAAVVADRAGLGPREAR